MNKPLPDLSSTKRKRQLPPGIATGLALVLIAGYLGLDRLLDTPQGNLQTRQNDIQSRLQGQAFPLPARELLQAQLPKARQLCGHSGYLQMLQQQQDECLELLQQRQQPCEQQLLTQMPAQIQDNDSARRYGKAYFSCLMSPE